MPGEGNAIGEPLPVGLGMAERYRAYSWFSRFSIEKPAMTSGLNAYPAYRFTRLYAAVGGNTGWPLLTGMSLNGFAATACHRTATVSLRSRNRAPAVVVSWSGETLASGAPVVTSCPRTWLPATPANQRPVSRAYGRDVAPLSGPCCLTSTSHPP